MNFLTRFLCHHGNLLGGLNYVLSSLTFYHNEKTLLFWTSGFYVGEELYKKIHAVTDTC